MNYIVLELFPEPYIVQNSEGNVFIFEDKALAKQQAEECQQGMVVPLSQNLMDDIIHAYITDKGSCLEEYVTGRTFIYS